MNYTSSGQAAVAQIVMSSGPVRLVDNGKHYDELPDGTDFIGFGEGNA